MKKTKFISLVLITAGLASCHQHKKKVQDWQSANQQQVYMRSDESAPYSQQNSWEITCCGIMPSVLMDIIIMAVILGLAITAVE